MRAQAPRAGVFLDFDGSLSRIVARPEHARPVAGAREAIAALVGHYRLVAIVSGRRSEEVADRLSVPGLRYLGLYGIEQAPELMSAVLPRAESAAAIVPEAWVEDKRASIAVHYRQAPDPVLARAELVTALQEVASSAGLELVEGKMVVELLPPDRPGKGGAIERLAGEHGLTAAMFAGDDVADLDAFAALDRLAGAGLLAIRVAVEGEGTPDALVRGADLVVDGPEGLVDLLRQIA